MKFNIAIFQKQLAFGSASRLKMWGMTEHDRVRITDPTMAESFGIVDVEFGTEGNIGRVVTLSIFPDGTFKIPGSSTVPTDDAVPYMEAYGRALAFIRRQGLKPRPAKR